MFSRKRLTRSRLRAPVAVAPEPIVVRELACMSVVTSGLASHVTADVAIGFCQRLSVEAVDFPLFFFAAEFATGGVSAFSDNRKTTRRFDACANNTRAGIDAHLSQAPFLFPVVSRI